MAWARASSSLHAEWLPSSAASSSSKFVFRSHPFVVVLSIMDSTHDSGGKLSSNRSIHGPIVLATNSNMSSVARHLKFSSSTIGTVSSNSPWTCVSSIAIGGYAEGCGIHINTLVCALEEVEEEVDIGDVFVLEFDCAAFRCYKL